VGIRLYCGVTEKKWNRIPASPGKYACVSPVMNSKKYGTQETRIHVPDNTTVIQDSGAFCDGIENRISYHESLNRQKNHADKYGYADRVSHMASYDLLINEKWNSPGDNLWSKQDADYAVLETINAAKFLRENDEGNVILTAQGASLEHYMNCTEEIAPLVREDDIFGLGGWVILGSRKNNLRNAFREIIIDVIPFLYKYKIRWIHIWGVIYPFPLGELLAVCDVFDIRVSTDSSSPQTYPIFGWWGYGDWKDREYKVEDVSIRGEKRKLHVAETRKWLKNFRKTKYYRLPSKDYIWKEK